MEAKSATIGSDPWKNASVKTIKLSQTVVGRSDKGCEMGQQLDPLPSLRDTSIQQSNARIHAYVRATRAVLVKLRESLLDTNEEIKSLIRGKESLEKILEHIRKDIILNSRSNKVRFLRPPREKVSIWSPFIINISCQSINFRQYLLVRGICFDKQEVSKIYWCLVSGNDIY